MIEIIRPAARGQIRHALFDFDGTLSLLREGWQQVMVPMAVEVLLQTPQAESAGEIEAVVLEFVTRLTGKETIFQMMRLAEEVARRGGRAETPVCYKRTYLKRLWARIKDRRAGLDAGRIAPEEMLVPGARGVLENLRARGVRCYLVSGTDDADVRAEAAALRLTDYFAYVGGALENFTQGAKRTVIERVMAENKLAGPEFAVFGDGFVEIEETKRVGGIAIGVASNEATRQGRDEWKRARLIQAGADVIVPDFREQEELVEYLFEAEREQNKINRRDAKTPRTA